MGLGGVLDEHEPVLPRERGDGTHVGALAVEMDGDDRARPRRRRVRELARIERERALVHIDKYRGRTGGLDAGDRRDAGVGRCDHLVTGSDAERTERELDGVGAVRDADRFRAPQYAANAPSNASTCGPPMKRPPSSTSPSARSSSSRSARC